MVAHSKQISTAGYTFIANEIPIGDINGINTVFTLSNVPVLNSVIVRLSGVVQVPGTGKDYTISNAVITFFKAPKVGQEVAVGYFK